MNIVKTICTECSASLEFPSDFDNVVCSGCGATHQVRDYDGAISLRVIRTGPVDWQNQSEARGSASTSDQSSLAELDELIAEIESEIEAVRAREQSGPLQIGCAAFGVFGLVLLVIAGFMLVGRSLVGRPPFYFALVLVAIIGIARARQKIMTQPASSVLRADRLRLEETLAELEAERGRLAGR